MASPVGQQVKKQVPSADDGVIMASAEDGKNTTDSSEARTTSETLNDGATHAAASPALTRKRRREKQQEQQSNADGTAEVSRRNNNIKKPRAADTDTSLEKNADEEEKHPSVGEARTKFRCKGKRKRKNTWGVHLRTPLQFRILTIFLLPLGCSMDFRSFGHQKTA